MRPILVHAIASLRPNAEWVLHSEDELEWRDDSPVPTMLELQAELKRLQKEYDAQEYARLRRCEYPPLEDFADALYWLRNGDEDPMLAYEARVSEVKAKYPKPKPQRTRKKAE